MAVVPDYTFSVNQNETKCTEDNFNHYINLLKIHSSLLYSASCTMAASSILGWFGLFLISQWDNHIYRRHGDRNKGPKA